MKRIVVIPARGGSERISRKNIKLFAGRPIIAFAIECAKESGLFDNVIVSTDDDEIEEVAWANGATMIHRRKADDGSRGTQEVAKVAALESVPDAHLVCCLYATTPLLLPRHLHAGLSCLQARDGCYSMAVGTDPLRDAGAYYWSRLDALVEGTPLIGPRTVLVPLPEDRVCDINEYSDWRKCEEMYWRLGA
jgi:pseudaminic acid cytidylyltransferase